MKKEPKQESAPEGLHALQYARQICEEQLGWPSKANLELLGDCITSISRTKKLTLVQAHKYLSRAVKLAKEQGVTIEYRWFSNGEYMNVRPTHSAAKDYAPIDRKALENEQATKEWQEASAHCREMLKKLAGKVAMK